jgi:hypothetical protein
MADAATVATRNRFIGAARDGNLDELEAMANARSPEEFLKLCRSWKCEALWTAASEGRLEVLRWMKKRCLAAGLPAEKFSADCRKDGMALYLAAKEGHMEVLEWLAENGAAGEHCRQSESTALGWAAYYGRIDVLDWLRQQLVGVGMSAEEFTEECRAADVKRVRCEILRNAAATGRVEVLRWLAAHGAGTTGDCRANDCEALRKAAERGHIEALRWLREAGAATPEDCAALDGQALKLAEKNGHVGVCALLRSWMD